MDCTACFAKLDAFLDGELPPEEARSVRDHVLGCPSCTAESLSRTQLKRALHGAARRFVPDPAFRARVRAQLAPRRRSFWTAPRWIAAAGAVAALLIAAVLLLGFARRQQEERKLVSELLDLHVATLASANPVDVVSSDRHTVKPWFRGRIPFTFNLPELQGTEFTLVGGRMTYLNQAPGAELIFRARQHQISVFMFRENERGMEALRSGDSALGTLSFNVRSWTHNGVRFFLIGDASSADVDQLAALLKAAG